MQISFKKIIRPQKVCLTNEIFKDPSLQPLLASCLPTVPNFFCCICFIQTLLNLWERSLVVRAEGSKLRESPAVSVLRALGDVEE